MSKSLDNIKLGYSPLSKKIYLYRHGKDPREALEKRNAEADVMAVFIQHMLEGTPGGAEQIITFGDKSYLVSCRPYDPQAEDLAVSEQIG